MDRTPTHGTIWSPQDAIAFLRAEEASGTTQWQQLCLRLAANAYGYAASNQPDVQGDGDHDVADYWQSVKPAFKHEGDRRPPLGALAVFGSAGRFGHVAVVVRSEGGGMVTLANDDVGASGRVRPLSLAAIEGTLNLRYLGWVEPSFPHAAVGNPKGLPWSKPPIPVHRQALFLGNTDSESVRVLQRRLRRVLGTSLPVTGSYDARTRQAVRAFQRDCCRFTGSGADGLVWDREAQSGGEQGCRLLFPKRRFVVRSGKVPDSDRRIVIPPDTQAHPTPTGTAVVPGAATLPVDDDAPGPVKPRVDLRRLVPGLRNASVRHLQARLNQVAGAGLAETGRYDAATLAAVRAWQTSIGDGEFADGRLGPRQFAKLFPLRRYRRAGGPPERLTLSRRGQDFIVEFEGFSATLYNDQAGHCTIGVGHLVHHGACRPSEGGLEKGITRARALALMVRDASTKIDCVASNVKVDLDQAQFDALVSFTFNVGEAAFESSTLLKRLNKGDLAGVPEELKRWNKITVNGRKVASKGLTRRRAREARLFTTGAYTA
jgi:GH24 family phage-related lysozyme (muramidase)